MDYTQSPDHSTHPGTGRRMHDLSGPVTTEVTDDDMNSIIWSLMEVLNAAGVAGVQFDPGVPGSYDRFLVALRKLFLSSKADEWIDDSSGKHLLFSALAGASYLNGLGATHLQVDGTTVLRANAGGTVTLAQDAGLADQATRLGQVQALIAASGNGRPGHTYNLSSDWIWINKAEGFILQWGVVAAGPGATTPVTYPVAFTQGRVVNLVSTLFSGTVTVVSVGELDGSAGLGGFTYYNSNTAGPTTAIWLALGR